jgi:hypothetical protein
MAFYDRDSACLLLIGAVLLYVCLGRWTRRERSALGLSNEVIVSADDSALRTPTLRSARYGLVGRPDQLVSVRRMLIPVEHKPKARRMQQSHVLQLAAQCLLVHEVDGVAHRTDCWSLRMAVRSGSSSRRHSRGAYSTQWHGCVLCCAQMPSPDRAGSPRSAGHAGSVRRAGS